MKTSQERADAFEKDLIILLKKHSAAIEIQYCDEDRHGIEQPRIFAIMQMICSPSGDKILEEYSEYKMGDYINALKRS